MILVFTPDKHHERCISGILKMTHFKVLMKSNQFIKEKVNTKKTKLSIQQILTTNIVISIFIIRNSTSLNKMLNPSLISVIIFLDEVKELKWND